ncbi:unnamed protein product [Lymnaea stagnalis]|uniref:Proton-coupled folate transporter n=1 Tax=Lymnaea stagnalis TaxID=6523 RepID=A0AAV2HI76_LYMST
MGCGCPDARCRCRPRLVTVEPVLFLYMFSSNLQFPTFQSLVYKKTCLQIFNSSFCDDMDNKTFQKLHTAQQDAIQRDASNWMMLSNIGITLPAIMTVFLFIGSWGDKINRKLPILLPCVGSLIYNLSNLLNAYYMDWSLDYLMIGPIFDGLFGGYITVLMGVYSYITNISNPGSKTVRVGIVESMTFFAGTVSVFISGLILEAVGYVMVFVIVCSSLGVAALYGLFWLESIKPEYADDKRKSFCMKWLVSPLKDTCRCMVRPRGDRLKLCLALKILVLCIIQMCTTGENDILYLYLKRSPRSFTSTEYGYFKGTENFTRSLALLTILPLLKHRFHLRDSTVVIVGIVSKACGLILLGLANNMLLVFLVVVFAMFQGFPSAGLRSSLTDLVDQDEHGRLFAIVAAAESLVTLASTFIFNGWYPTTLYYFDGTCFQFAAGMCGLALAITIGTRWHTENKTIAETSPQKQKYSAPLLQKQNYSTATPKGTKPHNCLEYKRQGRGELDKRQNKAMHMTARSLHQPTDLVQIEYSI